MDSGDAVIVPASMLDKNAPVLGKVRCWYAPNRWIYAGDTPPPAAETNGIQLPPFWIFPRCYFVTDRGQVYKYAQSYLMIFVRLVSVTEIPEPEVRALIEQELKHLPRN